MDVKLCLNCRSENPADADFCWKCYASFEGMNAPLKPEAGGETPVAVAPPPARTRPSRKREEPSEPRMVQLLASKSIRSGAVVVLVVALFLGGVSFFRTLHPDFPASVGSYARDTEPAAEQAEGAIEAWGTGNGYQIAARMYGSSASGQTTFLMIRIKEWNDRVTADQLLVSLADIGSQAKASPKTIQRFTVEGVDYACVASASGKGSVCEWQVGDNEMIAVSGPGGVQTTLALTTQAHIAF